MIEKTSVKKRVKIVSFVMGMTAIFSGAMLGGYHFTKHYRNTIEYTYLKTLNDLSSYVLKLEASFNTRAA